MRGICSISCFVVAFSVIFLAIAEPTAAQKKYNPNHPEVEAMVRKGLSFIKAKPPVTLDRRVLAALTIVEASKRYDSLVPSDDPQVAETVADVLKAIRNERIFKEREVYYPALAVILLCDVGTEEYAEEIQTLVTHIVDRQEPNGAYVYQGEEGKGLGDTSQTQYAALALWVAFNRGFNVPLESPKGMLEFYLDNQTNSSWFYTYENGRAHVSSTFFLSIHTASLGSVYLLGDLLQVNPKSSRRPTKGKKGESEEVVEIGDELPPSVSVYVPPKEGEPDRNKAGPLVTVNTGQLSSVKRAGNNYLESNFEIAYNWWGYYYLYALERYAFFREKSEGSVREIPDWYDQGVELMKTRQEQSGAFALKGGKGELNTFESSSFAILFLVRSSEILIPPSGVGDLKGGNTLASNVRLDIQGGGIRSFDAVKGLDDVLGLLNGGQLDEDQFELIQDSLASSIGELADSKDREQLNTLRGYVTDRNYFKRLIAMKLLARQQSMDTVPYLIYALGDPDIRICQAAHNALRLISRKLDSIQVPQTATLADYITVKNQWTKWFLEIRPGAELLD